MHGGAVGAVAERVSIACAKTVVGKDKELFLGELSMSYVSAAPSNVSSKAFIECPLTSMWQCQWVLLYRNFVRANAHHVVYPSPPSPTKNKNKKQKISFCYLFLIVLSPFVF